MSQLSLFVFSAHMWFKLKKVNVWQDKTHYKIHAYFLNSTSNTKFLIEAQSWMKSQAKNNLIVFVHSLSLNSNFKMKKIINIIYSSLERRHYSLFHAISRNLRISWLRSEFTEVFVYLFVYLWNFLELFRTFWKWRENLNLKLS